MLRKVTLSSKDISAKQWASLILELNLIKNAWKPYARIDMQTAGLKKIITFGTRTHDSKED
jgi:hypothetical protein|tara:strand:- start:5 stop:187 length:183 start_codon:yes stop_codon:yes gene_type:complete